MRFTSTSAQHASTDLEIEDASLAELERLLSTYDVGDKNGPAIIPAIFEHCPPVCRRHKHPKSVDCGGGKPHRLNQNVRAMTGVGFDVDEPPPERLEAVLAALRARGITHFWWHTHSFGIKAGARARVIVPFAEELDLPSPHYWRNVAWPALVTELGFRGLADKACADPARIYFLPRKPGADSPQRAGAHLGDLFAWKDTLGTPELFRPSGPIIVPETEDEDPARPVDLDDFRHRLAAFRKKPGADLLAKVRAGVAPVRPPQFRMPSDMQREPAWLEITKLMAIAAHPWEATEALLSIVEASWEAEVADSPDDHTDWEHIVDLFVRARPKAPEWKARAQAKQREASALFKRSIGKRYSEPATPSEKPNAGEDDADPEAWREELITCPDGQGGVKLKSSPANLGLIFHHAPEWAGAFRLNQLGEMVEIHGGPTHFGAPRWFRDSDTTEISNWLERSAYGISLPPHAVLAQIHLVARSSSYHPVHNRLAGLEWDGVKRIDHALERYFGAELVAAEGRDNTRYVRAVSRKFLISCVARAMRPGCKVDTMLVLAGEQGEGKSMAARILACGFFADMGSTDLGDKDAAMIAGSNWIVEISELDALSRSAVNTQKGFLSREFDVYRPPYGRSPIRQPRQSVFIGTTNLNDYLRDPTGNRRYWPIRVLRLDLEGLKRDVLQLWAEAVAAFKAGEQWWLTKEEQLLADEITELNEEPDPYAEKITEYILSRPPRARPKDLRVLDICEKVFSLTTPTKAEATAIGIAIRRLRLHKHKVTRGGARFFVYDVPEAWLNAPEQLKTPSLPAAPAKREPPAEKNP